MSAIIVPYVNNLPIMNYVCGGDNLVVLVGTHISLRGKTINVPDSPSVEWEWDEGGNPATFSSDVVNPKYADAGTFTYIFRVFANPTITCEITIEFIESVNIGSAYLDGHFVLTDCNGERDIPINQDNVANISLYANQNAQVKFVVDTVPVDDFFYYTYLWGSSVVDNPIQSDNTTDTITINVKDNTSTTYFLSVTNITYDVPYYYWLVVNNSALEDPPVLPLDITSFTLTISGEDPRTGSCGDEFFFSSLPSGTISVDAEITGGEEPYTQNFVPVLHAETTNSRTYSISVTDKSCQEKQCFFTLSRGLSISSLIINETPICCGGVLKTCCPMEDSACTFLIRGNVHSNQYSTLLYRIKNETNDMEISTGSLVLDANMEGTTDEASFMLPIEQVETQICVEFFVLDGETEIPVTSCCGLIEREDCSDPPFVNTAYVIVDGNTLVNGGEYSHCCADTLCTVPVNGYVITNEYEGELLPYTLKVNDIEIELGSVEINNHIGTTVIYNVDLTDEQTVVCFEFGAGEFTIDTACATITRKDCTCPALTVSNVSVYDGDTGILSPVACGGYYINCCQMSGSGCGYEALGQIQTTLSELYGEEINYSIQLGENDPQFDTVIIDDTGKGTSVFYPFYPDLEKESEPLTITFYTDDINDPLSVCTITVETKQCSCPVFSVPTILLDGVEFVCGSTYNKCCDRFNSGCPLTIQGKLQTTITDEIYYTIVYDDTELLVGSAIPNSEHIVVTDLIEDFFISESPLAITVTFYTDEEHENIIGTCEIIVETKNCTCPDFSVPTIILDGVEFVCGSIYNKCCEIFGSECPLTIQGKLQTTITDEIYYTIDYGSESFSAAATPSSENIVVTTLRDYEIQSSPLTVTVTFYRDEEHEHEIETCVVTVDAEVCCPEPIDVRFEFMEINGILTLCGGSYPILCQNGECSDVNIAGYNFITEEVTLWYEIVIDDVVEYTGGPVDNNGNNFIETDTFTYTIPDSVDSLNVVIRYYEEDPTNDPPPQTMFSECYQTIELLRCPGENDPMTLSNLVIDDNPIGCNGVYSKFCEGETECAISIGGIVRSNEHTNLQYEIEINGTLVQDGEVEIIGSIGTVEATIPPHILTEDETSVCIYFYNLEQLATSCCTTVVRRTCTAPVEDCRCSKCPKGKSILWYGQKRCGKLTSYRVLNQ